MGVDYNDIGYYDLNEDLRIIANDVGIDIARTLLKKIPGVTIQLPYKFDFNNSSIKLISDRCGEDIVKKVHKHCGGMNFTIPKLLPRRVLQRYIRDNFNGLNAKNLTIELNISEKTFYNILGETMKKEKNEDDLFKNLMKG